MSHAGDTDPDMPSFHTEDKVNLEELEETSDEEEAEFTLEQINNVLALIILMYWVQFRKADTAA